MRTIVLMRFFAKVQQFRDTLDPLVDEAALHAIDAMEAWVKANAKDLDCENLYDVIDEYEVGSDLYGGCAEEDCEDDEGYEETDGGGEGECEDDGKEDGSKEESLCRFAEFCLDGEPEDIAVPSGFPNLDNISDGLHSGEITIVASLPGIGATAFGLSVAVNVIMKSNLPVAYFSIDKSYLQLTERLVMAADRLCGAGAGAVLTPDRTQVRIRLGERRSAPLYIDDTRNLSLEDFRSRAETYVREKMVDLIIVDTFELLDNPGVYLHLEDDKEARMMCLHKVASLGVPVIALGRLSNGRRKNEGGMPWLCGINGIVKDCSDEVILLHRDGEMWGENEVAQAMVFRGTKEPCWQRLLCYDADGCCFRELE